MGAGAGEVQASGVSEIKISKQPDGSFAITITSDDGTQSDEVAADLSAVIEMITEKLGSNEATETEGTPKMGGGMPAMPAGPGSEIDSFMSPKGRKGY
jgi:hypothetical protein